MSVVTKEAPERRQEAEDVRRCLRTSCVSVGFRWASPRKRHLSSSRKEADQCFDCWRQKMPQMSSFLLKWLFLDDALGGLFHHERHIFSLCPRCRLMFKSNHWVLDASSGRQAGWGKLAAGFVPASPPSKETQKLVELGTFLMCHRLSFLVDPDDEAATRSAGYTDD